MGEHALVDERGHGPGRYGTLRPESLHNAFPRRATYKFKQVVERVRRGHAVVSSYSRVAGNEARAARDPRASALCCSSFTISPKGIKTIESGSGTPPCRTSMRLAVHRTSRKPRLSLTRIVSPTIG